MATWCHPLALPVRNSMIICKFVPFSFKPLASLSHPVLPRQPWGWQLMQTPLSSTAGRDRMCTSSGIMPELLAVICFQPYFWWETFSSSGAWRVTACLRRSWAPLWWCTAPGPAGPGSRLVHVLAVEEFLIARVNAPIRGEWWRSRTVNQIVRVPFLHIPDLPLEGGIVREQMLKLNFVTSR